MFDTSLEHYPFTGLPNTRDLGGMPTGDGRRVRSGVLLRSTTLERASDDDRQLLLDRWNLKTVVDLRSPTEQSRESYDRGLWPNVRFIDCPVLDQEAAGVSREGATNPLERLKALKNLLHPHAVMRDVYASALPSKTGQRAYRTFFRTLLDHSEGAILWHCTMGKDRAGMATALLLYALGVPFDRIHADHLATNEYLAASPIDENLRSAKAYHLPAALSGLFAIFNGVEPGYLLLAWESAGKEYGTMDAYLAEALEVGPDERAALQAKFLE